MRAFLLAGILAVSTSFLMAQTPVKVEGLNASSAETVISVSLVSSSIGSYSKVNGLQEWVSDFVEFNSHIVQKYRARFDFRLEGTVLWVTMTDFQGLNSDGWGQALIPAKGAEQKLILQMVDRLNSTQKLLPASPPVAATNGRAAAPPPAPFSGLQVPSIPGSDSNSQSSNRAAAEPASIPAPRESAVPVTSTKAYPPTIVEISLGMPYAAAHKIGVALYSPKQLNGLNFHSGSMLRGEAWAEDNSNATAVAASNSGLVDFVAREKTYPNVTARPTWDNFRKALIAQYGPPSRENEGGEDVPPIVES
jgi:hypothetical protein